MAYRVECEGPFASENATEADIDRAFDDDPARGQFIILEAPDGSYIQAATDDNDIFILEFRAAGEHQNLQASGTLTKPQTRSAFLQFLKGEQTWRTTRQWHPLKSTGSGAGCMSMILLAIGIATVITKFVATKLS